MLYHDRIRLVEQPCSKSDSINKVVTKLFTACSKLVDNLGQAVGTQLVDDLLADLLQDASFFRFLRVYVGRITKPPSGNEDLLKAQFRLLNDGFYNPFN